MNLIENFGSYVCETVLPIAIDHTESVCNQETSKVISAVLAVSFGAWFGTKAFSSLYQRIYPQNDSSLIASAKAGNIAGIRKWISYGVDVNSIDPDSGDTSLIAAARGGHTQIVRELVKAGAKLDIGNTSTGQTALHVSCSRFHTPVVQALLQAKANPNTPDQKGWTPLMSTIESKAYNAFDALINAPGINLDGKNEEGNSAVHLAAGENFDIFLSTLLQKGANANLTNQKNEIPLHNAAKSGCPKNVKLLLEVTTSKDIQNVEGKTPFFLAIRRDFSSPKTPREPFSKLLLNESNPNIPDQEGTCPIHLIVKEAKGQEDLALELLEEAKMDCNLKDGQGNTPAHLAAQEEMSPVLDALKKRNVSFDVQNTKGETPLGLALIKGKSVEPFLESIPVESLQKMKIEGLSLIDYVVVHGLEEFRAFLSKKGIYFELTESNQDQLKAQLLKVMTQDLQIVRDLSPIKISDLLEVIQELENPKEPKSERLEQLELSIQHYLERVALQSRHQRHGTKIERAEFLGLIFPTKVILKELLGPRLSEFVQAFKKHCTNLPFRMRALFVRSYTLGELIRYGIEAFQAFVPFQLQEEKK